MTIKNKSLRLLTMSLSKIRLLIALTICVCMTARSQDSIQKQHKLKIAAAYNVNGGILYAHGLGLSVQLKQKHLLELNALLLPVSNFSSKTSFGSSLNYCFLPFKATHLFNLFFTSSIYLNKYSYVQEYGIWPNMNQFRDESKNTDINLLLGLGVDIKFTKRFHASFSLSCLMANGFFSKEKNINYIYGTESKYSNTRFEYLSFDNSLMNDVLAKAGIRYYFRY